MRRYELPQELGNGFSVSTALAAGVTPSRLRALDLGRPFHGVRSRGDQGASFGGRVRTPQETTVIRLCLLYATRMVESQFFSHVTAAVLWGLPVPLWMVTDLIDVAVFSPGRNPAGRNIRGHEVHSKLATTRIHPDFGVRVASPASTWAMLADVITPRRDLVALADAVVREPMFRGDGPAFATVEHLGSVVGAGRRRGIANLRDALPLVRTRSASRRETWCRLALVACGLPEPELNWTVVDASGKRVACADLAYPNLKIAMEYEGEQHLTDPEQWARDIDRHARLVDLGWVVIRVTKHQLRNGARDFTDRVDRAIAARG